MDVGYEPGHPLTEAQTYFSPALLADNSPLLPEFCARKLHGIRQSVEGMRRSGSEELPAAEALLQALETLAPAE
jgi:hypothetical protein